MKRTVIGLVADPASGKSEVSAVLQQNGFLYYTLSDSLRNIATSLGLSHERESLRNLVTALRTNFGPDILVRGALRFAEQNAEHNIVIDGIRNPREIDILKKELDTTVMGITMPLEKRFELMIARGRAGDPTTWEEFMELNRIENTPGENSINVQQCLEMADVTIVNEGSLQDLYFRTQEFLLSRGIGYEGTLSIK